MAYVQTRLGRFFYEERGRARSPDDAAIVLLHGYLFDGRMWAPQVGPLAELGRVLVFDGPGHGKTEVPPPFSLEDHAEALGDAFRELGVASAILIGLSWGGMVAMRFAIAHGDRVRAIALLDTSADVHPRSERLKNRAFLSLHRRMGFPLALFEREVAPIMWGPNARRYQRDLVTQAARDTLGFDREGVYRAGKAVMIERTYLEPKLSSIRAPTLVLCGKDDRATPPDHSRRIASKILGARLALVDDCGHTSTLEQPDAVNAELVPFVKDALEARTPSARPHAAS